MVTQIPRERKFPGEEFLHTTVLIILVTTLFNGILLKLLPWLLNISKAGNDARNIDKDEDAEETNWRLEVLYEYYYMLNDVENNKLRRIFCILLVLVTVSHLTSKYWQQLGFYERYKNVLKLILKSSKSYFFKQSCIS